MGSYNRNSEGRRVRDSIQEAVVKRNVSKASSPNMGDAVEFDMAVDEIISQLSEHPDISENMVSELMDNLNAGRENVLLAMIGRRSTTE